MSAVRSSNSVSAVSTVSAGRVIDGRVSFEQLLSAAGCVVLALLPGIPTLPIGITVAVGALIAVRLLYAVRGGDAPPMALRFGIAALAIPLLFLQFHTFNGLGPGTALLSLIAGLKLLETRAQRDIHVITMIVYFLSLATLLEGESFWLMLYLIAVCWLTTSTLLRLRDGAGSVAEPWRVSLRHAGKLMGQALPLAVAFWLFFPRLNGPLWQLPDDGSGATIGLSDTMSPGDITDLAQSDEVAFRARFVGTTPPEEQRYWRGPVLHDFDGHTWSRTAGDKSQPPAENPTAKVVFSGPAYRYTLSLEPSPHRWLFALDWPAEWDNSQASLSEDYMLLAHDTPVQPIDVTATSYGHMRAAAPLDAELRDRDTAPMPAGRNPRTLELAAQLHAAHPDTLGYVQAVLDLFRRQPFYYTLKPPRLRTDSVDGFLFDSRRGFCGHYASAFATLMRAAGIPARVVTGYQGGTFNRFAGYWILRQSDAHAWDEVWLEGQGWVRIDPTASIPADRVERGLNDLGAGAPQSSRWQQRTRWLPSLRLELDALKLFWRERILEFDQHSQERLLEWLHVPEPDGQKLAFILTASLIAGMMWLTWTVRRELEAAPRDPLQRAYAKLCRRLGAIGLARLPHEGAEAYAARVAAIRPDLAEAPALCLRYSALRYSILEESADGGSAVQVFIADVRRFKPRDSRGSRGIRSAANAPPSVPG